MLEDFLFFIFFAICVGGFYIAYLYGRKTKNFRWREYFAIIIFPLLCVLYLVIFYNPKILNLFLLSSIIGFFLEYLVGLAYHKTLNKRLWVYGKYSVGGYTSFLTLPIWGIAGVVFWMLSLLVMV